MYALGIDIGSTTVKYVMCDQDLRIITKAYTPHHTKQAHTLLALLDSLSHTHPEAYRDIHHVYITGSGASRIAPTLNARFVQEVNAIVLAVEHLHPDVNAVIELGGQDAKIIHFKQDNRDTKTVTTAMNDKCASGTGATIEKCTQKVGMRDEQLQSLRFQPQTLHHVAAKCGVFAETDVINLIKTSIPADEIMNSLADAIVMQNLTVLMRGTTLRPNVLLLGGPNAHLPFLQECWRHRISQLWDERDVPYEKNRLRQLIHAPENAEYYAALGAILFGRENIQTADHPFEGLQKLKALTTGEQIHTMTEDAPLIDSAEALESFKHMYQLPAFHAPKLTQKTTCFLGIDGGSTSSKAILCDEKGALLCKVYQLSRGNPIEDVLALLQQIRESDPNGYYAIRGLGVTGYAADVLGGALNADVKIVETVAHMKSAEHAFKEPVDVICDIGGQDIKVLFLKNGMMKNFRLSNQCSAGNGMLLQSMAEQFGVSMEDFAPAAFKAQKTPRFNYGCAVFLDTDRVTFQKEGYTKEELFAGLAKVLPKNIWQYVVQSSHLASLGNHFVLQGGTQYNLAALKAQVDYILAHNPDAKVSLHPHPGEAGAYGAALEAKERYSRTGISTFVGIDAALAMTYHSKTDESTRCGFCSVRCARTFIDTQTPESEPIRFIAGYACEKGTLESPEALKTLNAEKKVLQQNVPNLLQDDLASLFNPTFIPAKPPREITRQKVIPTLNGWGPVLRRNITKPFEYSGTLEKAKRQQLKIAIPRVLNIYSITPFIYAYFKALGIKPHQILFSSFSHESMYLEGAKYGSVDSCYPSKVAQSHVYALLSGQKEFDYLWFPSITELPSFMTHSMGETACPVVSGTPKVVYAAFVKEKDLFSANNVEYIDHALNFDNPALLTKQLFGTWKEKLWMTEDENAWAVEQAWKALEHNDAMLMKEGKKILEEAVENKEIVILLLGRPYHLDPGLNHEILDSFQALGYKVLSMRSIPKDEKYLLTYFGKEIENRTIQSPFDISDVWQENFSTNSSQKVWAAKFAARHPNIAVVDLSSFKCGHDAPTYGIIDQILEESGTPHLTLHDLDANKPGGSITIRVKTFDHALKEYKSLYAT